MGQAVQRCNSHRSAVPAELTEQIPAAHLLQRPVEIVHRQAGVGDAHRDLGLVKMLLCQGDELPEAACLFPGKVRRIVAGAVGHIGKVI